MTIFPTEILLAADGSEEARLALRTAVDLADRTNSELHVVTVRRTHPVGAYEIYNEEVTEGLRRQAQTVLDEQVKKIKEDGMRVAGAHHKVSDRPDEAIVQLSEEFGCWPDCDGQSWARWVEACPYGQRLRFCSSPRPLPGLGRAPGQECR